MSYLLVLYCLRDKKYATDTAMRKHFSKFWLNAARRDTRIARWNGAHRTPEQLDARAIARDIATRTPRSIVKNK